MSTYTDLHNRVKENITVDYNNRITAQRVRLFNEQNEFWGTLRGHVSAENINIEGGSLSGVTLTDTILKGSVALPDGIDLHKVLQQVQQISTDLIQTNVNLNQEVIDRKVAVEEEKDTRVSALNYETSQRIQKDGKLSDAVDQTNIDLKREISTLNIVLTHQDYDISTALSNIIDSKVHAEELERINSDSKIYEHINYLSDATDYLSNVADYLSDTADFLSDAIIDSRADFGREVFDRTVADNKLELSIATEAANSIARDNSLSVALSNHIVDNETKFANLSLDVLSSIEHERHYVINPGTSTTKTTDTWPYSCKDYAVNIYNPTINNGAVYYTDAAGVRYEIGQLYQNTTASLYPFTFKTLKDIQHPGVASALVDNWSYGFDTDKKSQRTLMNGYSITFDDTKSTHVLSDFSFVVAPTLPQFHKMKYDGLMIGKVTDADPVDYTEDIVSGKIWIDTMDSELETFNKFRNVSFNTTDLSVCNNQTERITYLGQNKFRFEKNIDRAKFIGLYDKLNDDHYQFGRIYDSYNSISGIIKDISGIAEINVRLSNPYNKLLNLKRENGFKNIIEEDVKFGDIYYNTILSANITDLSGTFDEVKVSELYKYNFTAINKDGETVIGGYVVPKKYNKTIIESLDFDSIDANISDVMWITAFKKSYTLTKTTETSLWTVEDSDEDGNVLNIKFNGTTLYIKVTSGFDGTIVRQEHPVRVNEPTVFNTDTCYTHVYTTNLVDLREYKEVYEAPEATYTITVDPEVMSETFPRYDLGIDTSFTGALKIQIPERSTLDIAREFMVVINPDSYTDSLIKLIFVNADGSEAKIVCNRRDMLLIPTKKWTTLQVKEINHNIFYVMDLDGNESEHDFIFLSNAISVETNNRISNDTFLSDTIELSVAELQDQVISNDNDIEYLSNTVDFMLSVDKETMNYKGTLPYLPNLSDAISHEDLGYNYLSTFIMQNMGIHKDNTLKLGDFFKLSAIQSCLYDASIPQKAIWFGAKDYFVINKTKDASALITDDLDIFRNAESEVEWLSGALCAEIDNLSTSLSTTIKLSVENLQNQIDFSQRDYVFISSEIRRLSTEISNNIDNLSADLSNDIDSLSTRLSTDVNMLSVKISTDIDSLSTRLSTDIDSLSTRLSHDIDNLSAYLSNDIDSLSVSLSNTIKLSVENIQGQVISNDNDIDYLSGTVDFILSAGKDMIEYKGTVPHYEPTSPLTSDYNLSAFIKPMVKDPSGFIKKGYMYRLSAVQDTLSDYTGYTTYLGSKDFFIINKNAFLSNIKFDDLDIFRNAESEFKWLSTALCIEIDNLSTSLSDTTRISVENLQDQIVGNDNDIEFLSTEAKRLSTEISANIDALSTSLSTTTKLSAEELQHQIVSNDNDIDYLSSCNDYLSAEVSCNNNDISYISSEVIKNDDDIEFLSADLSTLEYSHYNKTLSNDISVDHTYEDIEHHTVKITKVVDQLIILDEVTFDRYRLTIRNGALNINKIDNVVPTI